MVTLVSVRKWLVSSKGRNTKRCKGVTAAGWHISKQCILTLRSWGPAPFLVIICYHKFSENWEWKAAHIFHFSTPSTHISFSGEYICESQPAIGDWERSLLSHVKILTASYYTIICRKLLYKSSFRRHGSNLVYSLKSYIKENVRWPKKKKKPPNCEVFNVWNTEQSSKLELNSLNYFS